LVFEEAVDHLVSGFFYFVIFISFCYLGI